MNRATRPPPATLRLFAAVEPDVAARTALCALQREWVQCAGPIHGLRPLPRPSLHMTLRFFGATPATRIELLADGLQELAARATPCTAHIQGIEYWPPPAPRVVVAVFDEPSQLQELATVIEEFARQLGFPPELRPFRAHVTLARSTGAPLPAYTNPVPQLPLPVRNVSLMQSRTDPAGAQYHALHRFALRAPAA